MTQRAISIADQTDGKWVATREAASESSDSGSEKRHIQLVDLIPNRIMWEATDEPSMLRTVMIDYSGDSMTVTNNLNKTDVLEVKDCQGCIFWARTNNVPTGITDPPLKLIVTPIVCVDLNTGKVKPVALLPPITPKTVYPFGDGGNSNSIFDHIHYYDNGNRWPLYIINAIQTFGCDYIYFHVRSNQDVSGASVSIWGVPASTMGRQTFIDDLVTSGNYGDFSVPANT